MAHAKDNDAMVVVVSQLIQSKIIVEIAVRVNYGEIMVNGKLLMAFRLKYFRLILTWTTSPLLLSVLKIHCKDAHCDR